MATKLLAQSQQAPDFVPQTVEIITNDQGVEFFAEENPHREQILALLSQYDNLKLIACRRAIERRQKHGKSIHLLSAVSTDRPAVDIMVEKMQQGWGYKKF